MYKAAMPGIIAIVSLFFLLEHTALADEKPLTYDRINMAVSASDEVLNDTLVAVLYAQREGSDAAQLSEEVNHNINWAAELVKKTKGVKLQTIDYRTSPVYRKQALSGWRVRQSIRIESRDAARLSTLIGRLQERLAVESIAYMISFEKRQAAEDRLIREAIASFKRRAELITKQLDRSDYRLVHMDVNSSSQPIRPPHIRAMAMEKAAVPPTLEPGTQTVRININGTIELQIK